LRRAGHHAAAALAVLAAGTSMSACTEVKSADKEHYSPAAIAPVKGGEDDLVSVTLTQEGADRIEIATGSVASRAGGQKVIPYAALLYENDGSAFVYTNPSGLTYVRAHVEVDRVAGDRVLLSEGPAAGTKVVTTGAPQVHGAELEYGEY
jgi:multidrug efflux pump subunit AcrA (membrane-fusion protein)